MFDLKGYEASLLEGAWVTLEVALASLLLALLLGMLGALAKLSPYKGQGYCHRLHHHYSRYP